MPFSELWTVIVAFTNHLLCLVSSLPLGAIFWSRTVIVAFTYHLLCLISLPLGAIFWIMNCDSGIYWPFTLFNCRASSAVGNVSGYRYLSDCRSRGREFDPGPVPYFRGDWSWNDFYGHSPPFRWFIQGGLLSVTSESMCTNYWLTACSSLPRKKCG